MKVIFEKVRYKNFLSAGNHWIEISLNRSPSTLISGKNGNGKSTIVEAICFGLFGKAFRKINLPQLVNSVNKKDCVVEVEFSVSGESFKVIRGINKKIFEIYKNGVLLDQNADNRDYQKVLETQIIKMNFKSFTQVVILGSALYIPFLELSTGERRRVVEELLDIEVFSRMNELLSSHRSSNKRELELAVKDEDSLKNLLLAKKQTINILLKNLEESNEAKEEELRELETESDVSKAEIAIFEDSIKNHVKQKEKLDKILSVEQVFKQKKHVAETTLKQLRASLENPSRECLHCHRAFESDHLKEHLSTLQEQVVQEEKNLSQIIDKIGQIEILKSECPYNAIEHEEHRNKLYSIKQSLAKIEIQINRLKNEASNNLSETIEAQKKELSELKKRWLVQCEAIKKLKEEAEVLRLSTETLKDSGLKAKIIKSYVPIINKSIDKYLKQMELYVGFQIDENFNETIKSKGREVFSYASFSEGEKQRINLALLFAWRDVARVRNSVNTNLLILDETFDSSLDDIGTEALLAIISELSDTNVFAISHAKNELLYDRFRSTITMEKSGGFSRIAV